MNQKKLARGCKGAAYLFVIICSLLASGYGLLEPIVKTTRPTTAIITTTEMTRKQVVGGFCGAFLGLLCGSGCPLANAMTIDKPSSSGIMSSTTSPMTSPPSYMASYKALSIPVEQFGVTVPVACWIPSKKGNDYSPSSSSVSYDHRISVRRIGQLLAKWDFIPEFTSRDFTLSPTSSFVTMGEDLPTNGNSVDGMPVVILAHGYLGSRYDLSHLAEQLANEGFLCLAPEYPESLAASYERLDGLDRAVINDRLLKAMSTEWKLPVSKYGIVGHSAGCGTALKTGDASWTRVCISGIPLAVQRDGTPMPDKVLYVTSTNDFVMKRFATDPLPTDSFDLITEDSLPSMIGKTKIPTKAIYQLDRPDAPNHISFLAEGTNNAMIDLLSPLLPVAQALDIPVLDFDQYQKSRDSVATAKAYQPLVIQYLKQQMMS